MFIPWAFRSRRIQFSLFSKYNLSYSCSEAYHVRLSICVSFRPEGKPESARFENCYAKVVCSRWFPARALAQHYLSKLQCLLHAFDSLFSFPIRFRSCTSLLGPRDELCLCWHWKSFLSASAVPFWPKLCPNLVRLDVIRLMMVRDLFFTT